MNMPLMPVGPMPRQSLPAQNKQVVRLVLDRFWRDSEAQRIWAARAKECYEFFEGIQWTEAQVAELRRQKRPAFSYNFIAALGRLVMGYMRNNKMDTTYRPTGDGPSDAEVAEALTALGKHISERNQEPWVDAEVFADGLIGGRGYWDQRLDWSTNDFGDECMTALDPFATYPDSEAESYDISTHSRVTVARWVSFEQVLFAYGPAAAEAVRPYLSESSVPGWGGTAMIDASGPEITPKRTFAEVEDPSVAPFRDFYHTELMDPARKNMRLIDMQHAVTQWGHVFIDLETGDRLPVPSEFGRVEVEKALAHAKARANPMTVDYAPVRRVRWTVLIGDVIVHDDWSPYENFTVTGYFPYFRRGKTRGMVEDLIDPQKEFNKSKSTEVDVLNRDAASGWVIHARSMQPHEKSNWKRNSSSPGFVGEWSGDHDWMKPQKIQPSHPPAGEARRQEQSFDAMRQISGINEAALGDLDKVMSGRALEARQRQAVISIQVYMDNFARSKELTGRRRLEIIQRHYKEERVFRIMGEDGKQAALWVNKAVLGPDGEVVSRLKDLTLGRYSVAVDEAPLSATFTNAQFEEMLTILKQLGPIGQLLAQTRPDLIIDLSSLPRKQEWIDALRVAAATRARAAAMGPGGGPEDGGGGPSPNGGGQPSALDESTAPGGNVVRIAR